MVEEGENETCDGWWLVFGASQELLDCLPLLLREAMRAAAPCCGPGFCLRDLGQNVEMPQSL